MCLNGLGVVCAQKSGVAEMGVITTFSELVPAELLCAAQDSCSRPFSRSGFSGPELSRGAACHLTEGQVSGLRWPWTSVPCCCGRWHSHESPSAELCQPKQGLSPRVFSTRASVGPAALKPAFLGLSQAQGPLDAVTTARPLPKISTCACDFVHRFWGSLPSLSQ